MIQRSITLVLILPVFHVCLCVHNFRFAFCLFLNIGRRFGVRCYTVCQLTIVGGMLRVSGFHYKFLYRSSRPLYLRFICLLRPHSIGRV